MKKANGRKIKILLFLVLFLISIIPVAYFVWQNIAPQREMARYEMTELSETLEVPPVERMDETDYLEMRISDLENEIQRKNSTIDNLILENQPGPMDIMMWVSTFLLNILSVFGMVKSFRKTV